MNLTFQPFNVTDSLDTLENQDALNSTSSNDDTSKITHLLIYVYIGSAFSTIGVIIAIIYFLKSA